MLCPDFAMESCPDNHPDTIEGMNPAQAKAEYSKLRWKAHVCKRQTDAMINAQGRCKKESSRLTGSK